MQKRKTYFIDKKFQVKMITTVVGLILGAILLSGILSYSFAMYLERQSDVQFYGTSDGSINDMIAISSMFIVKPVVTRALIAGGLLSVIISTVFMLMYSHKLAGPVYRLEKHLEGMTEGDYSKELKFREKDEFTHLADVVNRLQDKLKEEKEQG
jgi:methyl-accepting chemotaxis protein